MLRLVVLACICFFAHSALAASYIDIAYAKNLKEKLDIYTPEKSCAQNTCAVMVYVHGGAWRMGDKSHVHHKTQAFNNAGYIFVSVNYPMLPDMPVAGQAGSVAKAVAWVGKFIGRYGGDASQIHLMGHSAGAHLVALIAADHGYLQQVKAAPEIIRSVTSVDGAAIHTVMRMKTIDTKIRLMQKMFYNAFGQNPMNWAKLSPYEHMVPGKYLPPYLLFCVASREDSCAAVKAVSARLTQLGIKTKFISVPDSTHSSINKQMGTRNDVVFSEIRKFIR